MQPAENCRPGPCHAPFAPPPAATVDVSACRIRAVFISMTMMISVTLQCNAQVMYALDQTLSRYEVRRAAGAHLSSSAPLLSVDEGLVPLHTADDLVRQYNCGDLNSTLFASVDDRPSVSADGGSGSPPDVAITRQINDYFRSELIDKRNRRMALRIDRLLTGRPDLSFFFAFGAGRLRPRRSES